MSDDDNIFGFKAEGKDVVDLTSRVLDTFEKGSGNWFEKTKIKRRADGENYARLKKAETDQKINKIVRHEEIEHIKHENEVAKLSQTRSAEIMGEYSSLSFEERTQVRTNYQEQKKQANIEGVYAHTLIELQDTTEVPEETVDDDWNTRFTNTVADVSNEAMQKLWGRVLAGEIKKPGTFSIRTLDLLKNLSQKEAEIFIKASKLCFKFGRSGFGILNISDLANAKDDTNLGISFDEYKLLVDIGILQAADTSSSATLAKDEVAGIAFGFQNGALILTNSHEKELNLSITRTLFTPFGVDLLNLNKEECTFSDEYLLAIKKSLNLENDKKIQLKYYNKIIRKQNITHFKSKPRII